MTRLNRRSFGLALGSAFLVVAGPLAAHDLFLKLNSYFLPQNTAVRVPVLNGTFIRSESILARDRVASLTLTGPSGSTALDTTALSARGDTSYIRFATAGEGSYVLGLSVKPRDVDYTGEELTEYLKAEGYAEVLAERAANGTTAQAGRRRYATHVKAIFQVSAGRSESYAAVLGANAEIIPLENPYGLKRGATLRVRCLIDGRPAEGLRVSAGGRTATGSLIPETTVQTGADGIASITLNNSGRWYIKFAKMRSVSEPGLNYESQRATLTFQIT